MDYRNFRSQYSPAGRPGGYLRNKNEGKVTEPNHHGQASVPTYTAMNAEHSPTSPQG